MEARIRSLRHALKWVIQDGRLKKMYAEERLKAEIVQEALQKKW